MRTLMLVVVLVLVGIVCVGFYRGWFQLSTDSVNQTSSATFTVDQEKIHEDEQKAKDKVQGFRQEAKEKTGDRTDEAKEPERRP